MAKILVILSEGLVPINQLSAVTLMRLQAGLKEWKREVHDLILVTGGTFLPPTVQTRPIAHVMREWLVAEGVQPDRILVEDRSKDSFENMQFSTKVLGDNGFTPDNSSLTIVSQWQHVLRTRYTASKYRWKTKPFNVRYSIGFKGMLMEFVFILVHLIDPYGTGIIARKNRVGRTYN